jgi:CubicO group peptidase (beta-lactamase class C family)
MAMMSDARTRLYVPPPDGGEWERISAKPAGFDPDALARAVLLAQGSETDWPVDLHAHIEAGFFEPPPHNEIIGPTAPRGLPNGILLKSGRIVASWGDTRRVDMTFSIAKSYLSLLAGVAFGDGLITDLDEPVGRTVKDGGFEGEHNSTITWRHLLQQTSEWEGTLFGKSDQIDRNRIVSLEGRSANKGEARPLAAPGRHWEYNDVRVNRMSLALVRRFGRALPEVFTERIMRPIGASSDWHWEGYRNSFVEIAGRQVQSVPGGGHWGGGMFIHAEDQARIALLALRDGLWGETRLLPETWMEWSRTPCDLNPAYGFMWWLNTGRTRFPGASATSYFALGSGGNMCWIDPAADIVAVLRWIDQGKADAFFRLVTSALAPRHSDSTP